MESSFTYLVINDIIIGIGVVIMINNNYDLGSIVIMKKKSTVQNKNLNVVVAALFASISALKKLPNLPKKITLIILEPL